MNPGEAIVYLVDDDESVRKAVARLFRTEGIQIETFASADEFLEFQVGSQPGCLVLDVNLPGITGMELQDRLNDNNFNLPIVFITGEGDIPMSVKAIKSGAADFLAKPVDNQLLLDTVSKAIELHCANRSRIEELSAFLHRINKLTQRERQVMDLVVEGLLNKQIAKRLEISEATVKVHRGRVMEKMDVSSVAELARLCERAGL